MPKKSWDFDYTNRDSVNALRRLQCEDRDFFNYEPEDTPVPPHYNPYFTLTLEEAYNSLPQEQRTNIGRI
jgi:DNA-directed RNA polymerase specialized sigma24 family protein